MPTSASTKARAKRSQRANAATATDPLETLFTLEENLHACITMEIKELEDRITEHPSLDPAWQTLKAFLRRPGKRVRPSLFLLSYSLFDGRDGPPPRAAFRVAGALEIFHAFALVHDDLIDCSDSRRGKPTLHRALEADVTRNERNAESMALVLGDILFGFAMECFIDPDLPVARSQAAMRYFLRIAQETGMGQASEIAHLDIPLDEISEEAILATYHLKTTRYTIECPLILGAMLAGGDAAAQKALSEFARPLGLAFQIENDLHEVELLPEVAPELAYDFRCGVKTLVLKRMHDALAPDRRSALRSALRRAEEPDGLASIARFVQESGVVKLLRDEIVRHFASARQALRASTLSAEEIQFLEMVESFIQNNRRHSESDSIASAQTA